MTLERRARPTSTRAAGALGRALGVGLALSALVSAADSGSPARAEPARRPLSLDDYRRFRALSIDLLGRMPTRAEIADLESGKDIGLWIDARLDEGAHAGRLTTTYLDLLRLEAPPGYLYNPAAAILRRTRITGPGGKETYVYFRRGQRRLRPETDGELCLTERETGLRVTLANQLAPEGQPVPVPRAILEKYTVLVRPWWLYRDARSASPVERYGTSAPFPRGFQPIRELLFEPDGAPTMDVRVCREEAEPAEKGTIFASGRLSAVPAEELGRQSPAPADTAYAVEHKGEIVPCRSANAFAMSADCGCGVALEACIPGDANSKDPRAFVVPTRWPLGIDQPLAEAPRGVSAWHELWWHEEVRQVLHHLFAEDRDLREVLTGRSTWVNGPLAQFYRATAPSTVGGRAKGFATTGATLPIAAPDAIPAGLSPHDTDVWMPTGDRGPRAAGLATTPAFLVKYASRRGRAAALYSTFLCRSFSAPDVNVTPSAVPDLTVRPGCAGCHAALEPLAAYFTRVVETSFAVMPASVFPVENASCRLDATGKLPYVCGFYYDPAFSDATRGLLRGAYGSPRNADLGPPGIAAEITSSRDFASCVVSRVAGAFLGRPLGPDDEALSRSLERTFVEGGHRAKALVRAVLLSDAYARRRAWGPSISGLPGGVQ